MDASFTFETVPRFNFIRVNMSGFFSIGDVESFISDYRNSLQNLAGQGHLTLVDITGMKIQSQESIELFRTLMAAPDVKSRKVAFLCSSNLARMQAQRLTDRDEVCFFKSLPEAEAWLFA